MSEKVELVIKIPRHYLTHPQDYSCLAECVRRGTPLPKGHGDLKDTDEIIEKIRRLPNAGIHWFVNAEAVFDIILNESTVIEAESGVQ